MHMFQDINIEVSWMSFGYKTVSFNLALIDASCGPQLNIKQNPFILNAIIKHI